MVSLVLQILVGYFRYCLDTLDDERQIKRWKGIASSFRGKLVTMIKDTGSKFDDYLISLKINKFCWIGVMN